MPNITKGKRLTAFGKVVKKRLIDLDMSQAELARAVGTSSANLSYILYGDRSDAAWAPRIETALKLREDEKNAGERRCG